MCLALQVHIATTIGGGMERRTAVLGLTSRNLISYRQRTCVPDGTTTLRLPDGLQRTVCDQGLKLGDFLYTIFWTDGSWYVFHFM